MAKERHSLAAAGAVLPDDTGGALAAAAVQHYRRTAGRLRRQRRCLVLAALATPPHLEVALAAGHEACGGRRRGAEISGQARRQRRAAAAAARVPPPLNLRCSVRPRATASSRHSAHIMQLRTERRSAGAPALPATTVPHACNCHCGAAKALCRAPASAGGVSPAASSLDWQFFAPSRAAAAAARRRAERLGNLLARPRAHLGVLLPLLAGVAVLQLLPATPPACGASCSSNRRRAALCR